MIYEKELSDKVIGCAIEVHKRLGGGYLEKVYENAMCIELDHQGLRFEKQVSLPVLYRDQIVGDYYADIIVENKVLLELKSCSAINQYHVAQLVNYLNASKIKVGYVLNFGDFEGLKFLRRVR